MHRLIAGIIVFLASGCASVENAIVYQPQPAQQPYEAPPAPLQDVMLASADSAEIHARWAPRPHAKNVVLFCHGNGGNVELWGRAVREIAGSLDASVLIFDYPGYGHSKGTASEAGCYAAAEAAYRWLVDVQKVPAAQIVLWGESIGGAVAVELGSRLPHRALVLVRTFTSLPEVADDQLPLLVSSPFMTNRYDSLQRIPQCKSPIFIASADNDRIVALRHGQRLHAVCAERAEFCLLRGLEHSDPLPPDFYHAVRRFLSTKAALK